MNVLQAPGAAVSRMVSPLVRILAAPICLLLMSCQPPAEVNAGDPTVIATHSDADIARFVTFHGPVGGKEIEDHWRDIYLGQRGHKAYAISDAGSFGGGFGFRDVEPAARAALASCEQRASERHLPGPCKIYAQDQEILLADARFQLPKLDVRVSHFSFNNEYVLRGPQRAKGVIVWSHGYYGTCLEQRFPGPALLNHFNLLGWDVLRFDRDPCYDEYWRSKDNLVQSVLALRKMNYHSIVLAGQSRGAWQSVAALSDPAVASSVAAVIAISPAMHGTGGNAVFNAKDEWSTMLGGIAGNNSRFVAAFFANDPYIPNAREESETGRKTLVARGSADLVIYEDDKAIIAEPNGQGSGHNGAYRLKFTALYADCLIKFVETGTKTDSCARF